jgi:hypothetical protein
MITFVWTASEDSRVAGVEFFSTSTRFIRMISSSNDPSHS